MVVNHLASDVFDILAAGPCVAREGGTTLHIPGLPMVLYTEMEVARVSRSQAGGRMDGNTFDFQLHHVQPDLVVLH